MNLFGCIVEVAQDTVARRTAVHSLVSADCVRGRDIENPAGRNMTVRVRTREGELGASAIVECCIEHRSLANAYQSRILTCLLIYGVPVVVCSNGSLKGGNRMCAIHCSLHTLTYRSLHGH